MVGEFELMYVYRDLLLFQEEVRTRFPSAREVWIDQFLQNATLCNHRLYQELIQCPSDIVVVDPLLNFVGNMSDYLKEQSAYFNQFHYSKITSVLTQNDIQAFASHWDRTKVEVQNLLDYAKNKGLKPYEPRMLDLPLCAYSYLEKTEIEDKEHTSSIQALNRQGSLRFSGLLHQDYHLDAVAEVKTLEQQDTALRIQEQLQAGNFYHANQHTFFVVPKINGASMAEKINDYYGRPRYR